MEIAAIEAITQIAAFAIVNLSDCTKHHLFALLLSRRGNCRAYSDSNGNTCAQVAHGRPDCNTDRSTYRYSRANLIHVGRLLRFSSSYCIRNKTIAAVSQDFRLVFRSTVLDKYGNVKTHVRGA